MPVIDPDVHGESLARAVVLGRQIAVPAVGMGLALAAGYQTVPVYGAVLGVMAAAVASGSGVLATILLFPRVERRAPGPARARRSAGEIAKMSMMLEATLGPIRSSEVRAGLRHTAETLAVVSGRVAGDIEIEHFCLLNMQSLVSIADAFVRTEEAGGGPEMVPHVLETLNDIDKAARRKVEMALVEAVGPLQVELAVSNRLIDDERSAT